MKWSSSGCGGDRNGRAYSFGDRTILTESSYPSSSSDRDHGSRGSNNNYNNPSGSHGNRERWPGWTEQDYQEMDAIVSRNQSLMQGFTGQVLGGAWGNKRHCRDYEQYPNVNKEMLYAARKVDRENNATSINFILFHNHYLNDDDMYWLSSIFNSHPDLAVNTVDLSNNEITLTTDHNYQDLPFFNFNYPYNTPRKILRLDLSNNQIGDEGAKLIANGLANGVLPITKHINLSGNNITAIGYNHLMTALEAPEVRSIMVTLVKNIVDLNQTVDQAMRNTIDFVTKGLRYAVEQHNQGLQGTKWDVNTVRTDSLDKWKNCKEVGQNLQKGFIGGLIKCMPLAKNPPAMFACAAQQAGLELLDPDTLWCAVEINEFVDEKTTELTGDCVIC
jgi:hypothetical protein